MVISAEPQEARPSTRSDLGRKTLGVMLPSLWGPCRRSRDCGPQLKCKPLLLHRIQEHYHTVLKGLRFLKMGQFQVPGPGIVVMFGRGVIQVLVLLYS